MSSLAGRKLKNSYILYIVTALISSLSFLRESVTFLSKADTEKTKNILMTSHL